MMWPRHSLFNSRVVAISYFVCSNCIVNLNRLGYMNFISTMTWVCIAGLVYHYIGYPLIVYIMSRLIPYTVRREDIQPRISVIVSAYNEEAVIAQKIDNTLALDYPRNSLEIIIVTDGSNDTTPDIHSPAQPAKRRQGCCHQPRGRQYNRGNTCIFGCQCLLQGGCPTQTRQKFP